MHQQAMAAATSQNLMLHVARNALGFLVPENYSALAID
jgi:hypothetical protein